MRDRAGAEPGDVPLDRPPLSRLPWDAFYAVVVAAVVAFLLLDHGGPGLGRAVVSSVLLVLGLLWYLATARRPWLFVAVLGAVQLAAVWIDHTAAFALFAWGPMVFQALPLRPALAVVAALDLLPVPIALLRDGTTAKVHGLLPLTALGLAFAALIGTYVARLTDQNQERAAMIAELTASRAEVARLSHEAGVATERSRLAAEIHDTLAQGFTSIIALTQAAESELDADPPAAARRLDLVVRTARDNLAEARALVAALAPADLQATGLGAALRRQLDRLAAETGLGTALHVADGAEAVPTALQVVLLRAAQEALSNARRHAGASTVEVVLRAAGAAVELTVTDDGAGFTPGAATAGFGLAGMRARAEQIGGSCTVASAPGAGTTVTVTLPVGAA
ncbi:sensor histidine kinase [Dactylosporangium sp. CS-033363]|uniref:sensor histidine kinase n=1 Tax=Dactylosporangium sp. CS-033363 TaxID=3239935 RepID=UPI003D8C87EA